MLGSYHADHEGIDVVNLRIGWLLTREELKEEGSRPGRDGRYARAMWLSPEDSRRAIAASVDSPLPHTPVTVNITSHNAEGYLTSREAAMKIGYHPRDDSALIFGDPE